MKRALQLRDRRIKKVLKRREVRRLHSRTKMDMKRRGLASDGNSLSTVTVKFPKSLTIQNKRGRRALYNALVEMKRSVGKRPVYLDFSELFLQYPSAVLLLVAELDFLKRKCGSAFNVRIFMPRNEISNQVLHQVGIAALCGKELPKARDHFDESVKHWRYATGTWMNDLPGKALERFEGHLPEELHSGMWKGVSEAIINSVQHAYLEPRNDGFGSCEETRWWMLSQVRDGELTVAVCDLGIGIPRSLPIRWGQSRIAALLSKFGVVNPEVSAVRAALEIGATRTNEDNRGRGLPQIWEDMKAHDGANILLLSNRALLHWGSKSRVETQREYDRSIFGTMVIWSVPISDGTKA